LGTCRRICCWDRVDQSLSAASAQLWVEVEKQWAVVSCQWSDSS
jgi:hypothetical protein